MRGPGNLDLPNQGGGLRGGAVAQSKFDMSHCLQAAELLQHFISLSQDTLSQQRAAKKNLEAWTRFRELLPPLASGGDASDAASPLANMASASEHLAAVMETLQSFVTQDDPHPQEHGGQQNPLVELVVCDVVKQLGKKSMGSVWMHKFGPTYTAVKWIKLADDRPTAASTDLQAGGGYTKQEKLVMLLREVHALQKLNHPHVVRLLGITMFDRMFDRMGRDLRTALSKAPSRDQGGAEGAHSVEHVGIVMEMCLHGSLQDFLAFAADLFTSERCRLGVVKTGERNYVFASRTCATEQEAMALMFINSWPLRLRIAREIAQALAACHDASIMHRDLTTYNIMLTESSRRDGGETLSWWTPVLSEGEPRVEVEFSQAWSVRLIDFGLSAPSHGHSAVARSISMHSPDWMAPECMESKPSPRGTHEFASDVYSFGIVLWSIFTLSAPLVSTKKGVGFTRLRAIQLMKQYETHLARLKEVDGEAEAAESLRGLPCPVLVQVCDLILACMQAEPSARPLASEVAQRLDQLEQRCRDMPHSHAVKQTPRLPFMSSDSRQYLAGLQKE